MRNFFKQGFLSPRFFQNLWVIALSLIGLTFGFARCDNGTESGGDLTLTGTVTISPSGTIEIGTPLTADYSGSENAKYRWNKGGTAISGAVGTNYTPQSAGSYTVTVSASGYRDMTSAAVAATIPRLSGNLSITPPGPVLTGIELTADYSGGESVNYQWNRGGAAISGETDISYTPQDGGSYTVTVSALGRQSKTSAAVSVTAPGRTPTPAAAMPSVAKTTPLQTSVTFALGNNPSFAAPSVWKVYTTLNGLDMASGVSATYSESTLTLTHVSDISVGIYYVSVTENGKTESARLPLTVTAYVPPTTVTLYNLSGRVTAPARGVAPVTAFQETQQYTGSVAWKTAGDTDHSGVFAAGTVYKALVTLTAKAGYTFSGVAADAFSYTGAAATNAADSGVVTITFPATAAAPGYGISLDQTGSYTFPAAVAGYGAQTSKTVTITNTGNQPTGGLTIALSGTDSASFALSAAAASSVTVSGTAAFTVVPKTGLAAGTYTATVTVSGGNGITAGFAVSFTVNTPTYGINLNQTEPYTFTEAVRDYAAQTPKTVTITNTGNQPTGALTIALSGAGSASFALSKASANSIAAGGNDTFTVVPKTGLAAGTYTATVTVSGNPNITVRSFYVSFTVSLPSLTGSVTITGDPCVAKTLGVDISALDGSETPSYQWQQDTSGNGAFADIAGANMPNYLVTAANLSNRIRVTVKRALYSGSVTSGATGIVTLPPLDSVEAVKTAIDASTHGVTVDDPIPLTLLAAFDLEDMTAADKGWQLLLSALQEKNKYVALDLSACAMSGTAFTPYKTNASGEDKVVSLTLPNAAQTITPETGSPYTFGKFTALTTVSGPGIITVSASAFRDLTSLASAHFPSAQTIKNTAFFGCTALSSVDISVATTVAAQILSVEWEPIRASPALPSPLARTARLLITPPRTTCSGTAAMRS